MARKSTAFGRFPTESRPFAPKGPHGSAALFSTSANLSRFRLRLLPETELETEFRHRRHNRIVTGLYGIACLALVVYAPEQSEQSEQLTPRRLQYVSPSSRQLSSLTAVSSPRQRFPGTQAGALLRKRAWRLLMAALPLNGRRRRDRFLPTLSLALSTSPLCNLVAAHPAFVRTAVFCLLTLPRGRIVEDLSHACAQFDPSVK